MTGYVIPFAWGLVVLAALIGWGGVVARLFGETGSRPDWGLAAGWGMALMLALGGVHALAGFARPWLLTTLVIAGAALFAGDAFAGRRRPAGSLVAVLLALAAAALLARYASAVSHQALSCGDDNIAYFAFVARLLDTGTLIEPFSLRRLSAYGGQTWLQALVMVVGDADQGYLLDRGIAAVVAFGLVLGLFRDPGRGGRAGLRPAHVLVALLLTVILPLPLLNSSSHYTGLVMLLTLFRTLARLPAGGGASPRRLWLVGLVAAGAASLKATILLAAAATLAAWWMIGLWRDRGGWRRHGGEAAHLAAATLAFLAPWMALMVRSSATPLFPLFPGNHRAGFAATYSGDLALGELVAQLGGFVLRPEVGLFVLPIVLYAFRRGSRAGLALYVGALVALVATVTTLTYDTAEILHRFVAPFLNAAFIATVAVIVDESLAATPAGVGTGARRAGDTVLWVLAIALLPVPVARDVGRIADTWGKTVLGDAGRAVYARAQGSVPAGAAILVMVKHPFAFDYGRNRIVNVDVPGAVSPDPGMPFFQGPGPLKDYLLAQSIGYVALRDFDAPGGCLYGRDIWTWHAKADNPMWRAQSKYYLDLMDNVAALAAGARVLHRERGLSVIALE